ncbi:hypothetical protein MA785_000847 [Vibrio parahaemolyticus]|nr:hypothetical protein [Vibrio parahaemolyticus]EJR2787956.1 hypothetical protein [Vibrio parahaemolyticus]
MTKQKTLLQDLQKNARSCNQFKSELADCAFAIKVFNQLAHESCFDELENLFALKENIERKRAAAVIMKLQALFETYMCDDSLGIEKIILNCISEDLVKAMKIISRFVPANKYGEEAITELIKEVAKDFSCSEEEILDQLRKAA